MANKIWTLRGCDQLPGTKPCGSVHVGCALHNVCACAGAVQGAQLAHLRHQGSADEPHHRAPAQNEEAFPAVMTQPVP